MTTDNGLHIPPHNIEAEQSVLGGLLISPDSWDRIADILSEGDFYRNDHKLVFRHITRLIETGITPDIITVSESLERTKKLELIGGLAYMGSLAQNTPSAANIANYAKIVRDKRKERDFKAAIIELHEVSENHENISAKIENAVAILTALADDKKTGIVKLSEAASKAIESLEHRMASGNDIHGLKTGLIDLDKKTGGLHPGDLIILAARPSMGKSAMSTNIAEQIAMDGGAVLMFSLEMSDEQLATRSLASIGTINMNTLRSAKLNDEDWPRLTHACAKIQDAPLFIDSNSSMTATQMHARARKIKRQHGLKLIVVDYLQLMQEGGDTRNNEISAITRKLKLMAKDLHVPVICLSQLSRKVEERADKRPMMSDLRDSGAIEQDADVIMFLYRDEYYNPDSPNKGAAELILAKQRMGETGMILLSFEGQYSRFKNFTGDYSFDRTPPKAKRGLA